MLTIILPGYSLKNKDWAESIANEMELGHKVLVHNWKHWTKGGSLSQKFEVEKILAEIGKDDVNIVAKSVGTLIAMLVLLKVSGNVNKIILCGIPSISSQRKDVFKIALKDFPKNRIVCFQNAKDPFVSYKEVVKFMREVDPKILVIEKPRSDHHYPYPEEFVKFLT